ncbi:MAG: TatA/E family twin arginine-targeting protein translocase [Acidobacteria bacterium]|nr:TatA/E family twin arginine-targeting protein translocase [Acidobacteriota bacterium]MBI3426520.1 TatA/E family twin arginine-targeting protein translocase [Acidobacteriota bacterium]
MGLGMPEVVLILVIALIVFGPRKLPELGKSLGQAMSQFRKASDEFKRTWEQEVELEKVRKSDTVSSHDGYGYDSQHHGDAAYGTDPDFNYGGDSSTSASPAAEPAPAALPEAPATVAAAAATEKKAEPHWI